MARFVAGGITSAGSTTLPLTSLYASATARPFLTALHLYNQSSTAVVLRLVRLSTAGTRGTAFPTGSATQEDLSAAGAVAYGTHTVAPTILGDLGYRMVLGASVGSGVILTFPDRQVTLSAVANNGVGVVVEGAGAGQILSAVWEWAE